MDRGLDEQHRDNAGLCLFNLGTGKGYSVLDMVNAFQDESGKRIPYAIVPRRSGDVAACFADPSKAEKELHWQAKKGLLDMCRDSWRWQDNNPDGYGN